ncbi:MAG: hypothetical protein ACREO3_11230 [Arenimonas sp.]
MWQGLLFLFLGLLGSAGPGHFGFRVLAYRHHRDKGYAFAPDTDDGGLGYSWWLMRFGHRALRDNALNVFGGNAGVMGWITLIGIAGTAVSIAMQR